MHAAFQGDVGGVEKQIHQHGFPAPDPAPQIQPRGGHHWFGKQTREQPDLACGIGLQPVAKRFQLRQNSMLCGIGAQLSCGNFGIIKVGQRHLHGFV